ncbi:MAG TPA: hypothetical protein VGP79_13005 [Bryobacteraceae bacterium]|nr:hypothetical protein [Bryobacteraceae bacterium]
MAVWTDCLAALKHHGLLLASDPKLPSVSTLVTGEPVRGSWWAHPKSHEIFRVLEKLAGRPDVLIVKLVAGKDTLVHRRLWPEVLAIGTAGESWQWKGISAEARAMHQELSRLGEIETSGPAAAQLEKRLLARGEQFHTRDGSHAKKIEAWEQWAARTGLEIGEVSAAVAKRTLESVFPGARMPWR